MKAKRCPICGGKPIFKEYATPKFVAPDLWEMTETGLEPVLMSKLIECEDCGAIGTLVSISFDEVIKCWNEGHVMQYICKEPALEVEDEQS